jgi:hypothetical protein
MPGRNARRSIRGRKAAFGRKLSESQSPSVASLFFAKASLTSCRWSGALVLAANFDLSNAEVRSILQQTAENLGLKQEH